MSNSKQPFRHFDLPVEHLASEGHYIPPKSLDPDEIERRRSMPSGVVMAEQQVRGIQVAANILRFLQDHEDSGLATDILSASLINTAWHNHAETAADVMRRRLFLPKNDEVEEPISRGFFVARTMVGLEEAEPIANRIRLSLEKGWKSPVESFKRKLGRSLGNSALILACVRQVNNISFSPAATERQHFTRQAAMSALKQSRLLYAEVGTNPTLAQFDDHDSDLMVYLRREGRNRGDTVTLEALEFASESQSRTD